MTSLNVAALAAPTTRNTESGLTRPKQPGAPKGPRSSGSAPDEEVVRLKPIRVSTALCGRLVKPAVIVCPMRGRADAVLPGTPSAPGTAGAEEAVARLAAAALRRVVDRAVPDLRRRREAEHAEAAEQVGAVDAQVHRQVGVVA